MHIFVSKITKFWDWHLHFWYVCTSYPACFVSEHSNYSNTIKVEGGEPFTDPWNSSALTYYKEAI